MASDIDLRAVRFLIAVAEAGSFGRAATRLYLSQPALSVQIRHLEEQLGTALLVRSYNGVTLTAAGELVVREGGQLVAAAERLRVAVAVLAGRSRPTLRLGFLANAAAELTPPLVRAFERRRPDVQLELYEFAFDDPLLGLGDGRSDAALLRPPVDGVDDLELLELFREPRVAVLPIGHRLARRTSVRAVELLEEPWVAGSYGAFRAFWTLQAHRREPAPVVAEGSTVAEWWSVVSLGRAICAAPASAARYDRRPELVFVPIEDAEPSVCALAWRRADAAPGLDGLVGAAREVRRHLGIHAAERIDASGASGSAGPS